MGNITGILILCLAIAGCTAKEDGLTGPKSYDPRIPGGNPNGQVNLAPITNLTFDSAIVGRMIFKFKVPEIYKTITGQVNVYRKTCSPIGAGAANCEIVDPTGTTFDQNEYFKIGSTIADSFIDATVAPGRTYTYWFTVETSVGYSEVVRLTAQAKPNTVSFTINPVKLWESIYWGYGYPETSGATSQITLKAASSAPGNKKGGIAIHGTGSIMAISDTDRNRVVIYASSAALTCSTSLPADQYSACLLAGSGVPMSVSQVIGQPDFADGRSCAEHQAASTTYHNGDAFDARYCLTSPTSLRFDGDNLIISDTGNHRVLVHRNLKARELCAENVVPGTPNLTNCRHTKVFGQRSTDEIIDYTSDVQFAANGASALNSPGGLAVQDGVLYIADTKNHRVVSVNGYASDSASNCAFVSGSYTWGTEACRFSAVLGQKNMTTRERLLDLVPNCSEPTLASVFDRTGSAASPNGNAFLPEYQNYLRRHIANPSSIAIMGDGAMVVGGNEEFTGCPALGGGQEIELRSRALYFQVNPIREASPICSSPAAFSAGGCDANKVIGQGSFVSVPVVMDSSSYLIDLAYGIGNLTSLYAVGSDLMAVDNQNDRVLFWTNLKSNNSQGIYRTHAVENPNGAMNSSNSGNLPALSSITDIDGSASSNKIYILDLGIPRVFGISATQ